ncbi:MAG TPA: cytochrome P450 [Polyangiales bacterium]|nr:cytochrome P450 [Polyangiales bacterium]
MSLPPTLPVPAAVQSLLWIQKPTQMMDMWSAWYGHAYRLKLIPFTLNLFSDPASIRTIFAAKQDEMHAGVINRVLRVLVGDHSVLLLDGAEHMRRRKLLIPAFHGERMRFYGQTMADVTQQTIATLAPGESFSIHQHTQEITLQIILRTVFGAEEGAELETLHEQIKRLLSVGEYKIAFVAMMYLARRPDKDSQMPWQLLLMERNRTDALLYQIIARRRADPGAGGRKDVLATLMQARDEDGQPMSDPELRDELMTALAAGHETTATALAWAFERILSHPDVYRRLQDELRGAGGVGTRPDKLAALPYLDATCKEVLRQRPVVPAIGRLLREPASIGGYDLPKGTAVGVPIYLAHRNPDIYPEPDAFRPERFLNVQPDPLHWLPFGGGIRRCIGAQFALYEMKIVLGTLLAHCEFALDQTTPARAVRRAVTLFPEHGTRVRLTRRAA